MWHPCFPSQPETTRLYCINLLSQIIYQPKGNNTAPSGQAHAFTGRSSTFTDGRCVAREKPVSKKYQSKTISPVNRITNGSVAIREASFFLQLQQSAFRICKDKDTGHLS
jgi:hypothetical protein